MNFLIFSSRSTITARVGVCTRPTVVKWKPPVLELNAVMARVPLIPTSQSDSDRQTAASARGSIERSSRKAVANGRRRHGLEPEAFNRLAAPHIFDQIAKNQLPFAPRVAGVNE